jgi:hypothetical protein
MSMPAQATWPTDPVDIVAFVNEFRRLPRLSCCLCIFSARSALILARQA